jgi:hypothetical protein
MCGQPVIIQTFKKPVLNLWLTWQGKGQSTGFKVTLKGPEAALVEMPPRPPGHFTYPQHTHVMPVSTVIHVTLKVQLDICRAQCRPPGTSAGSRLA